MLKIRSNLVDGSKWDIKCPYPMKPQFVVIHNTYNDAPAENEIAYMRRNDEEVSFHYAVDDREAVQGILEDRNAWHAGDGGKGEGNRYGIAIEICYSKSGGPLFEAAERNAAKLAASILRRYGWGVDHLRKHQDFNGKNCPHRTLELGWPRFVDMVREELEHGDPEKYPKYTVGKIYKLQVNALSVRDGAGTEARRKSYSELTPNAKEHAYENGYLKIGTEVTCLETKTHKGNVWMRIPSGWVAAWYNGMYYVK